MKLSLYLLPDALLATQAAAANCSVWMEDIPHRGIAAFNTQEDFLVWRNVKDFGAKGDGVTDDTDAIQAAISANETYASSTATISTNTPNTVYFPPGTYMLRSSLQLHFATHLVGNPNCMPVFKALATFPTSTSFSYLIDGNYNEGWSDTVLFYRQVRNLILDTTIADPSSNISVIHWPASQATALQNLVVEMPEGSNHVGLIMSGGSGGYLSDLSFRGATRNWGLTYLGIQINDCNVGIRVSDVTQVRPVILVDSQISNTPLAVVTAYKPTGIITAAAVVLENVVCKNVTAIVQDGTGAALLAGRWHRHAPSHPTRPALLTAAGQGSSSSALVDGAYCSMSKPLYANESASAFLSVRVAGAVGDDVTDDTAAVQHALDTALARGQIAHFDAGVYRVSQTVTIPAGSRVVGENFATIMSSGSFFAGYSNPQPVVQVGMPGGADGTVYWSDMLVQVQGQQAGAKLIQWNLASPAGQPSGMWDVHGRTGGTLGTNLRAAECPKVTATQVNETNYNADCRAAYAQMHITSAAAGVYLENVWFWGSDVDLDERYTTSPQNLVYTARGLLVESADGPVWLLGAGFEHCVLYNFQFAGALTIFASQLQSETPYFMPNPPATLPFPAVSAVSDPVFSSNTTYTSPTTGATMPAAVSWGFRAVNSSDSLHTDWMNGCGDSGRCQARLVSLESSGVHYYDLHIVGADIMVTVDGEDIIPRASNLVNNVGEIAVFHSS
ncbi:hypothetical protein SCUCBS95973_008667 [Sporothrix curviconia]|uniref:Rhamnogalacturonase A/B/Epimerase-like pectate lyase domain-containing protein n=1 Tax=Sporothrix curviconia TaxID=1260050 RepID=A0ABP0CR27_9PEZI